jgi:4-hydroxybenzoate polyprenyltransferase
MLWAKIKTYMRLGRIHSSVLTGLAPVCTAAAMGISLPAPHYLLLFIIGFLFHIFLFVFNEIRDIDVDSTSTSLEAKPLIDGSMSIKKAKIFMYSSVVLIFLLTLVFFLDRAFILIIVSMAAFIFGGLYDILGKSFPHSDYFISFMIFFIALFGAFSVATTLSLFVIIISLLALTQMLINNIIAGLKDVDHDFIAGGMSTPLRVGVLVKGERFIVSKSFVTYLTFLKIIHISLTIIPFMTVLMPFEIWQFYIVTILIAIALIFMIRLLTFKTFNREKIMRAIGFHEMFAFMVIPFLLLGYIGYISALFLVLFPAVWLGIFLKIMYGKFMPAI